jgi:hypothetical protein
MNRLINTNEIELISNGDFNVDGKRNNKTVKEEFEDFKDEYDPRNIVSNAFSEEDEEAELKKRINVANKVCNDHVEEIEKICKPFVNMFNDDFGFDEDNNLKEIELSFMEKGRINRSERRIKDHLVDGLEYKIGLLDRQYKKLKDESKMGGGYKLLHKKEWAIAKYAMNVSKLKLDTYTQSKRMLIDAIDRDVEERFNEIRLYGDEYTEARERFNLERMASERMERLIY